MKKNKFFLPLLFLLIFSCNSTNYWELKLDLPRQPAFNLDEYKEIVITNFLINNPSEDFDLNQELVDYFKFQLKQNLELDVSFKDISVNDNQNFSDKNFWKKIPNLNNVLLFTGTAGYNKEIRKALLRKKESGPPFSQEPKLVERKFYSLLLTVYIIDPATGEILYQRELKQTKDYENPNQTAYFAFFDLVKQAKDNIFRQLLGKELLQERYLISD